MLRRPQGPTGQGDGFFISDTVSNRKLYATLIPLSHCLRFKFVGPIVSITWKVVVISLHSIRNMHVITVVILASHNLQSFAGEREVTQLQEIASAATSPAERGGIEVRSVESDSLGPANIYVHLDVFRRTHVFTKEEEYIYIAHILPQDLVRIYGTTLSIAQILRRYFSTTSGIRLSI